MVKLLRNHCTTLVKTPFVPSKVHTPIQARRNKVMLQPGGGGRGGPCPHPQKILADQLTVCQLGADYGHQMTTSAGFSDLPTALEDLGTVGLELSPLPFGRHTSLISIRGGRLRPPYRLYLKVVRRACLNWWFLVRAIVLHAGLVEVGGAGVAFAPLNNWQLQESRGTDSALLLCYCLNLIS